MIKRIHRSLLREREHITNIRNLRIDTFADSIDFKKIIREYFEKFLQT
jgi:3-dehydroquinate dehydratase